MALIDKDIIITPNTGLVANSTIDFFSATSNTAPKKLSIISASTYDGELFFTGSSGQMLSISNTTSGTKGRFEVYTSGGDSSLSVMDSGIVKLAGTVGFVTVGNGTTSSNTSSGALVVTGGVGVSENLNVAGTLNVPYILTNSITTPTAVFSATQGTQPFTVASNTKIVNLNADLLDGKDSSEFVLRSSSAAYIENTSAGLRTAATSTGALQTGGWTRNHSFYAGSGGTKSAQFGAYGSGDSINYAYISANGVANQYLSTSALRIYPTYVAWGNNRLLSVADEGTLDAGTLDGLNSTQFLRNDANGTLNGTLNVQSTSVPSVLTVGTGAVSGNHRVNINGGGVGQNFGYYLSNNPAITANTSSGNYLDIGRDNFTRQRFFTNSVMRLNMTDTLSTFTNETVSNIKFTAPTFQSTTTNTSPFTVASQVKVVNLNADLLDGFSSGYFAKSDGTSGTTFLVGDGITQNRIGFTHNDGYGNSNLVFNHASGIADVAGNVGRIWVNTDLNTGAYMRFQVGSNNTAGVLVATSTPLVLYENSAQITGGLNVSNGLGITGNIAVTGTVDGRDVAADGSKLDNITVTQPVNLDTIESRVNSLDAAVVLAGTWNVGATFPIGTPSTKAGMSWIVGTSGTFDGVTFDSGDRIVALVDSASTTVYTNNWLKLDYTDRVTAVQGRTGNVVVTKTDIGLSAVENTKLSTWPGTGNVTQVGTVTSGNWNGTAVPVSHGGTGSTTASTARSNLGIAIGTNVQAHSAILDATSATYTTALNTKLGVASTFYMNSTFSSSTNTADFITELTGKGAFQGNNVSFKTSWDYAGNSDLVTGHSTIGTIELAGCVVETWGNVNQKHIRITRPNTGTGLHGIYEYNDQGSTYSPGWREIWTSESDGSGSGLDADKLDGLHAASFVRSDVASTSNSLATFNAGISLPTSGAPLNLGNSSIYTSGDLNHIYVNVPLGFIPHTPTLSSAGTIGTSSYRWKGVYGGVGDFTGRLFTTSDILSTNGFEINNSTGAGYGLSLYSTSSKDPTYGLMFAQTVNKGTHGFVNGDWATYFTMNPTAGRGWIFTTDAVGTTGNVASISNAGDATFNNVELTNLKSSGKITNNLGNCTTGTDLASYKGYATTSNIIKVDMGSGFTNTMFKVKLVCYLYSTHSGFEISVSGYNYGVNNSFVNTEYSITGEETSDTPINVRLAHDGTNCCILLGNVGDVWNYPNVVVREVVASYSNHTAFVSGNWAISNIPNITGYTAINSPVRSYSAIKPGSITQTELASSVGIIPSTPSTIAKRNSSGDINARLFKSEYDITNANIGYIMTQIDTVSNNYIRPSTPAQLVDGLPATNLLTKIKSVDGSGSGLDADLLGGLASSSYIKESGGNYNFDIASNTNFSSYLSAAIEIRELNHGGVQTGVSSEAPRISFHWSGRAGSQIGMDSSGTIRTFNNPGTGYENFRAKNVTCDSAIIITPNSAIVNTAKYVNNPSNFYTIIDTGVTLTQPGQSFKITMNIESTYTAGVNERPRSETVTVRGTLNNHAGNYVTLSPCYYESTTREISETYFTDSVGFDYISVYNNSANPNIQIAIGNSSQIGTVLNVTVTKLELFQINSVPNISLTTSNTVNVTGATFSVLPQNYSPGAGDWLQPYLTAATASTPAFVEYDPVGTPIRYKKDSNGMVHIKGLVKGGYLNGKIFTLPVGARPSSVLIFGSIASGNVNARIDVNNDGGVYTRTGYSTLWTSLQISFMAEQ